MSDPNAILLVPSKEFFDVLLLRGPCSSRPPTQMVDAPEAMQVERAYDAGGGGLYWQCQSCGQTAQHHFSNEDRVERWRAIPHGWFCRHRALVLLYNGVVVPEGCDRAARVLHVAGGSFVVTRGYSPECALNIATDCARRDVGTVFTLPAS